MDKTATAFYSHMSKVSLTETDVDADVEKRHTRPPDVNYGVDEEEFASPIILSRSIMACRTLPYDEGGR